MLGWAGLCQAGGGSGGPAAEAEHKGSTRASGQVVGEEVKRPLRGVLLTPPQRVARAERARLLQRSRQAEGVSEEEANGLVCVLVRPAFWQRVG